MDLDRSVEAFMKETHMADRGDLVLAAVSGGADSVCLLLLLQKLSERMGFFLAAVHIEHGIRGESSQGDARFTEDLCKKLGILCHTFRVHVPAYAKAHGLGTEEAARRLRYEAFDAAALQMAKGGLASPQGWFLGAGDDADARIGRIFVALGHNESDQAETLLFRLCRGSGGLGLGGMRPVRRARSGCTFIRPLLLTSRPQIERYLADCGQDFRTDETNADDSYARNRIRHQLLPLLSAINAASLAHIGRTALLLQKQQDYIQTEAKRTLSSLADPAYASMGQNGAAAKLSLPIPELSALHPALQQEVLRQACSSLSGSERDFGAVHVRKLQQLMRQTSGSSLNLPHGVTAHRTFSSLVLTVSGRTYVRPAADRKVRGEAFAADPKEPDQEEVFVTGEMIDGRQERVSLPDGSAVCLRDFEGLLQGARKGGIRREDEGDVKILSQKKLSDGFSIRHPQSGDYFLMTNGHKKKLRQYLMEEHIGAQERGSLWLLAQGPLVIWVPGTKRLSASFAAADRADGIWVSYERSRRKEHGQTEEK